MSDSNQSGSVFVTKDLNLGEVAAKYPQAARVMMEYGLHCVGCFASSFDSVEQGALVHGMTEEEISGMLEEINQAIRDNPAETIADVAEAVIGGEIKNGETKIQNENG